MHVEDVKSELGQLAKLLSTTFEMEDAQRNLVTELVILKMKEMAKE